MVFEIDHDPCEVTIRHGDLVATGRAEVSLTYGNFIHTVAECEFRDGLFVTREDAREHKPEMKLPEGYEDWKLAGEGDLPIGELLQRRPDGTWIHYTQETPRITDGDFYVPNREIDPEIEFITNLTTRWGTHWDFAMRAGDGWVTWDAGYPPGDDACPLDDEHIASYTPAKMVAA